MRRSCAGMPPASEQEHTMSSQGVVVSSSRKAPSYFHMLCSVCTWKTQGSPLKMFYLAHRSISMNWSVWLHIAGFMKENK